MAPPQKGIEIAIIGGGIAGTTLAMALRKHGVACQIYEQGHAFSEIGAGVAFSPNALRAMDVCDASLRRAFDKVATHNQWPEKKDVYFDVLDGVTDDPARGGGSSSHPDVLFTLRNEQGQNAVHRGDFMDEVAAAIPEQRAHFRKHLDRIEEDEATGRLRLCFRDGTAAAADGVVGCDGIKSRTRALVVGEDHPSARPQYTHVYGYRGVVPMEQAVEHLGAERAMNASLFMGPDAHMLSYPVAGGKTFNMFGAVKDTGDWPSTEQLTLPTTREDALRDYAKLGPSVKKQLELAGEDIDRWALFDLGEHPVPHYHRGRIALAGDAAHATTPHHGAGAGFCVEDAAVLSELLGDARVRAPTHVAAVFAAYDAARRPRANWLVQSSRRMCELYQRRAAGTDPDDRAAVEEEMRDRYRVIWDYDLEAAIKNAKEHLGTLLG